MNKQIVKKLVFVLFILFIIIRQAMASDMIAPLIMGVALIAACLILSVIVTRFLCFKFGSKWWWLSFPIIVLIIYGIFLWYLL